MAADKLIDQRRHRAFVGCVGSGELRRQDAFTRSRLERRAVCIRDVGEYNIGTHAAKADAIALPAPVAPPAMSVTLPASRAETSSIIVRRKRRLPFPLWPAGLSGTPIVYKDVL